MPAHITHEVFAAEVFRAAFGELGDQSSLNGPYMVLGAQGPDFCLHNHRTKPTALIFGQLLHSDGYGTFIRHMVDYGIRNGLLFDSSFGAYVAAFATHAVLDRYTHPFINYFSGWVSPRHPESDQYYNCHPFLERIIDVFVLRIRTGVSIGNHDFLAKVDCGSDMPAELVESIGEAIISTYPEYTNPRNVMQRIENAYHDTRGFYQFTNPPDRRHTWSAYIREHGHGKQPRRVLALFHPEKLPELDYLNGSRHEWNHPGIADEIHTDSFFDLYEQALNRAVTVVTSVSSAFSGDIDLADLEFTVGNENLSDGRAKKARRQIEFVKPLPLQEVLQTIYNDLRSGEGKS